MFIKVYFMRGILERGRGEDGVRRENNIRKERDMKKERERDREKKVQIKKREKGGIKI